MKKYWTVAEDDMISIEKFKDKDTQSVIDLVLHLQNDGTRPLISVENQPDLLHITTEYIETGGYFWVAKDNGEAVGSIGLMPYDREIAFLKKFFVYEAYQGEPLHLGRQLFSKLLHFANEKGFRKIYLDTPKNTTRAHHFYEKAGFVKVNECDIPGSFSHPYQENDFFLLNL